jgi:hypothetical protein
MTTDELIQRLREAVARCDDAAQAFANDPIGSMVADLHRGLMEVELAHFKTPAEGSDGGYLEAFRPAEGGERFYQYGGDIDYLRTNRGPIILSSYVEIRAEVLRRADIADTSSISSAARTADVTFHTAKAELIPLLEGVFAATRDEAITRIREDVAALESDVLASSAAHVAAVESDATKYDCPPVLASRRPPHERMRMWLIRQEGFGKRCGDLASLGRQALIYLEAKASAGMPYAKAAGRKVFIGHGRSSVWKDLKDFITNRLHIEYEEFNRVPVAGRGTKERLEEMLETSGVAFLILTGEDEHADGQFHARENVVHEAGLFQGRLGFAKAIILAENSCERFSNIDGLTHIPFPKDNIRAAFEDVRLVLEREGFLAP